MKKIKNEIIESPFYDQFVRENREILSDINTKMHELVKSIENHNRIISGLSDDLNSLADISVAIHHQYKNRTGDEEIFKLKALTKGLKKNAMSGTINIESIFYLLDKTGKIISRSFLDIDPCAKEKEKPLPEPRAAEPQMKYKWFTFSRNGSWFILPFNEVAVIDPETIEITQKDGRRFASIDNFQAQIVDPMNPLAGKILIPAHLLRFDSNDYLYASDYNGKEIHASSDIVTPLIRPIKKHEKSGYRGRVRLFGIKYLYPESISPEVSNRQ